MARPMGKARLRAEACRLAAHRRYISEKETLIYIAKGQLRMTLTEHSAAEEAGLIFDAVMAATAKTAIELKDAIVAFAKDRFHMQKARSELFSLNGKDEDAARARCASFEARHISELFEALVPAAKT